jgi:hypothetical protein
VELSTSINFLVPNKLGRLELKPNKMSPKRERERKRGGGVESTKRENA